LLWDVAEGSQAGVASKGRQVSSLLDLDEIPVSERAKVWDVTIKDNYLDLNIQFNPKATPTGKITQTRAGSITLGAVASVAQVHERTTAGILDDVDHMLVIMQLRGTMHLQEISRDVTLKPGSLLLLDPTRAYRADFADDYQLFTVKIPRIFFQGALQSDPAFLYGCIDERQGSALVVDYFRRMARGYDALTREQKVRMSAHGVKLLVSTLAPVQDCTD
jgi:hypothetical protein